MKKILIISANRLGDSILSSGLIDYFNKKYKNVKVTFVCGEVPYELFKYCSNISKVISLKKKKYSVHWIILWLKVFLNFWDEIIDLRGTALSFFLMRKSKKIYFGKIKNLHKVISISNLVSNSIIEPKLFIKENIKKSHSFNELTLLSKKKKIIAISASANWIGKKWPISKYISLIKGLKKTSLFNQSIFILLGSKSERNELNFICTKINNIDIINLAGSMTLNEIYLILKKCKLFIGNDSGLMHLSAVSGINTIGLFGPSDIVQYSPWGINNLTISTPLSPYELMGKKSFSYKNESSLMNSLNVDFVKRKIISYYKSLK